jgi:predicted RNA-binding Zn ribbon-like protein
MMDEDIGLRVHEDESTPPAPGELELVRSFLSLHEHGVGTSSLPPTPPAMRWWLKHHDLVGPGEDPSDEELDRALELLEALRATVLTSEDGRRVDEVAVRTIDAAARDAGLELHFGSDGPASIRPAAGGVRGALGRLLSIAYLARLDGRWARFKECRSADCRSVFYDRSRNRSGRWCSMDSCGNRNKVRAWRERQEARERDD